MPAKTISTTEKRWIWGLGILTSALTILFGSPLLFPAVKEAISTFHQNFPLLLPLIVISVHIVAVIVAPVPSGWLSVLVVPFIGWFPVFLLDLVGNWVGDVVAFYLARKRGEPFVNKFVTLQKIRQWEARISSNSKLRHFMFVRLATGPISDYVSYFAGLTNISFGTFMVGTVLVDTVMNFIFYYLVGLGYGGQVGYFVILLFPISLGIYLVWKVL